jgi:hypothetical protein
MTFAKAINLQRAIACFCLSGMLATPCFADFHYQETTKITGGALVGMMKFAGAFSKDAKRATEPIVSTVLIKGNRMAHINPDTTEIVDLDQETITTIDHRKKQYTVMTFEQMRQQLEEAQKKAEQQRQQQSASQPAQQQGTNPQNVKMDFKVNVRNTEATKNVSGLDAKEAILSMVLEGTDQQTGQKGGLAFTNDMWNAPEIPGYDEVRDFNKRFATKMGMIFGNALKPSLAAMQPGSAEGMAEMVKEMSKIKGMPVMQVMRMGMTANGQPLAAASEAPLPPSNEIKMPSAGEVAKKSATSEITSRLGGLGGFGGFGRKKKQEQPQEPAAADPAQSQDATQSVLLESTTELTGFSSEAIPAAQFDVPAGYQLLKTQ